MELERALHFDLEQLQELPVNTMITNAEPKKKRKQSKLPELPPVDLATVWRWFCVVTGSASEGKVVLRLEKYLEMLEMQELVRASLIPTGHSLALGKNGEKVLKKERLFPGYLFVYAKMTPLLKNLILSIDSVSQIICDSQNRLLTIPDRQMEQIVVGMMHNSITSTVKKKFQPGVNVVVTGGSFQNFSGVVEDHINDKVVVKISIFGRQTKISYDENLIELAK